MVHKVEVGYFLSQDVLGIPESPRDKGLLTGVIAESCQACWAHSMGQGPRGVCGRVQVGFQVLQTCDLCSGVSESANNTTPMKWSPTWWTASLKH